MGMSGDCSLFVNDLFVQLPDCFEIEPTSPGKNSLIHPRAVWPAHSGAIAASLRANMLHPLAGMLALCA